MLVRNRGALDAIMEQLLARERLGGEEVAAIVERLGHPDDLKERAKAKEVAFM